MKPELVASAKPKHHTIKVMDKTFVYSRVRIKELSNDKCYVQLMKQVAKIVLIRVKQIVHTNQDVWRERQVSELPIKIDSCTISADDSTLEYEF